MTNNRKLGAALVIVIIAILAVVLLVGLAVLGWYIKGYNKAVRVEQAVDKAWGDVDAQLERRAVLVPQLVEVVKGYAAHEKELFESIARSREKYFQAGNVARKIEAANELGGFLSRLLMLQERYPDLKANQNFLSLQDQLEGTENRIAVARTRYNEAVRQLNTYAKELFGSFFCSKANVEPRQYFEASEQTRAEAPKVEF